MRIGLQNTDWGYVGAMLANACGTDQIIFFKAFVKECLGWDTKHQAMTQLAFINDGLTKEEKSILEMLGYSEGGEE